MTDLNLLGPSASLMAIANIAIYLLCIALAWWSLQEFRFDVLLKRPKSAPAKMLQILLSIALGHLVASFFIQYLGFSLGLHQMF
ncbi:DUF1146 domain-containing protein [Paenibacillus athensensis]|uniref:DUF1146 domain-containing protein n=1 Tax=Paenibacillus athensensis TaxID=1967502 RepID=A0A4Y8Q4F8_9BACL|nr:DUF1146 family protein [Paenibacillus athensensis]MCD1260878.1 DUF1146 domain-containing protein [Paenibacillus athensensis]